jgi:hypothetical protein
MTWIMLQPPYPVGNTPVWMCPRYSIVVVPKRKFVSEGESKHLSFRRQLNALLTYTSSYHTLLFVSKWALMYEGHTRLSSLTNKKFMPFAFRLTFQVTSRICGVYQISASSGVNLSIPRLNIRSNKEQVQHSEIPSSSLNQSILVFY